MSRSALVLAIPEVEPVVGRVRDLYDPVARLGVPAHVTLLFPLPAPDALDGEALRGFFAAHGALTLTLDRVAFFPEVAYLALADPGSVVALIADLAQAFPAYPSLRG